MGSGEPVGCGAVAEGALSLLLLLLDGGVLDGGSDLLDLVAAVDAVGLVLLKAVKLLLGLLNVLYGRVSASSDRASMKRYRTRKSKLTR